MTVRSSGSILMESVPLGVKLEDVKHDLEKVFSLFFQPRLDKVRTQLLT